MIKWKLNDAYVLGAVGKVSYEPFNLMGEEF